MATLQDSVERQVLILDGAMGTMIQQYELSEQDFRGERFRKLPLARNCLIYDLQKAPSWELSAFFD